MSDAVVTVLVSGLVQVMVLVIGLLTLLVKLKYGVNEAKESAVLAAEKTIEVEKKIDANMATTESVNLKADMIVDQTNGTLTQMGVLVTQIADRVNKLEDYNRTSSHRLFDAINNVHLRLMAVTSLPAANVMPDVPGIK